MTGALTSTFNDLFGNGADYRGLSAGTGDLSTEVAFADLAAPDLRLTAPQPSTDRGDPADNVGDEPAPNGGAHQSRCVRRHGGGGDERPFEVDRRRWDGRRRRPGPELHVGSVAAERDTVR